MRSEHVPELLVLITEGRLRPHWGFPVVLVVKNLPVNAGDIRGAASIPGSGRSPGGGHGNPLQYSCLENPMDRGTWRATILRITKSQTRLKWLWYICTRPHWQPGPLEAVPGHQGIDRTTHSLQLGTGFLWEGFVAGLGGSLKLGARPLQVTWHLSSQEPDLGENRRRDLFLVNVKSQNTSGLIFWRPRRPNSCISLFLAARAWNDSGVFHHWHPYQRDPVFYLPNNYLLSVCYVPSPVLGTDCTQWTARKALPL